MALLELPLDPRLSNDLTDEPPPRPLPELLLERMALLEPPLDPRLSNDRTDEPPLRPLPELLGRRMVPLLRLPLDPLLPNDRMDELPLRPLPELLGIRMEPPLRLLPDPPLIRTDPPEPEPLLLCRTDWELRWPPEDPDEPDPLPLRPKSSSGEATIRKITSPQRIAQLIFLFILNIASCLSQAYAHLRV